MRPRSSTSSCAHASQGAVVLKGNHDAAIERVDSYFNDDTRLSLERARPCCATTRSASSRGCRWWWWAEGDVRPRLGAPPGPVELRRLAPSAAHQCSEAAGTTYTFCGHMHDQQLYFGSPAHMRPFTPSLVWRSRCAALGRGSPSRRVRSHRDRPCRRLRHLRRRKARDRSSGALRPRGGRRKDPRGGTVWRSPIAWRWASRWARSRCA